MKTMIRLMAVAVGLMFTQMAIAQAPAGSTGVCKDGTYTSAPSKKGACRGHQGVKTWLAADTAAPAKESKMSKAAAAPAAAPAAATAASPAAAPERPMKASPTTSMPQASGGGPGMVWVNSATNVYHCAGTKYYGKTKAGSYMTESEAKAKGAHPDHNHPCGK
jgi:hypothetical protein